VSALETGHFFILNNKRKNSLRYLDYEFTIHEDCIEFDKELTIESVEKSGNFKQGDEFVLIVLAGKVKLIKADKLKNHTLHA